MYRDRTVPTGWKLKSLSLERTCPGIETGNRLKEAGLPVIATFAPIMPGITDVDLVLEALRPDIPLYIDRFYMKPDSIQEIRLMEYLRENARELMEEYRRLIRRE